LCITVAAVFVLIQLEDVTGDAGGLDGAATAAARTVAMGPKGGRTRRFSD